MRVAGGEVALDGSFQLLLEAVHRHGGQATAWLPSAHVVRVDAPVSGRLQVNEGTKRTVRAAARAEERALEEVVVHSLPSAPLSAGCHHGLDRLEQLDGDQRWMATLVDLAFVGDHAGVVRVSQNLGDRTERDRLLGPSAGGTSCQAASLELLAQTYERVVARRVHLERPSNERCAHGIDVDRVDEVAVERLADVEVAELGHPRCPALLGLMKHLVGDVATVVPDLDVVEAISEDLEQHRHVFVGAEVLGGADELDVARGEVVLDEYCVVEVPERPRAGVDDDVVDLARVVLEVGEHLAKDHPLGDRLRARSRLDELLCDVRAELACLALDELALGSD